MINPWIPASTTPRMTIDGQKEIAKQVLELIQDHIDDTAIVAGGAPRDWFFNNYAKDIDIFIHIPDVASQKIASMLRALDLDVTNLVNSAELSESYRSPFLISVIDVYMDGVQIQVINSTIPVTQYVNKFPVSISKIYFNGKDTVLTPEFEETITTNTIKVLCYEDLPQNDSYLKKIKRKFPDFTWDNPQKAKIRVAKIDPNSSYTDLAMPQIVPAYANVQDILDQFIGHPNNAQTQAQIQQAIESINRNMSAAGRDHMIAPIGTVRPDPNDPNALEIPITFAPNPALRRVNLDWSTAYGQELGSYDHAVDTLQYNHALPNDIPTS